MKKLIVMSLYLFFSPILNAPAQTANELSLANVPGQISNAQDNDTAGVLKLIGGFQVALFKGDARAFADLFAEDADFINVIDKSIHGREDIYRHHINVFKGRPATRKNNVLSYTVRFLKPDVVASEIKWDNKHTMGPDGTTLPDRDGVWVSVMTRENGQWYFKVVRNVMLNDGTRAVPKK
ncbi:MAG TPA: SgcJ/EcaC family oxidoreductase [Terriglobales bacterium]|jgi:uncharacterized protein (TIGR02246 family)|nr:SgcJ/EcaC family oxidoreductase [Terriglobales bacterium]